jgi:hypothetical protein
MPSKIVATYSFEQILQLGEKQPTDIPSLGTINPFILEIMAEDGRLGIDV